MNLNYFSLSILLLIILISCSVIVFQLKNNNLKNNLIQKNNKLFNLLEKNNIESFNNVLDSKWYEKNSENLTQNALDKLEGRLIISKISIDDTDNRKKIDIKGSNLGLITEVYFGEIKGLIMENKNDTEIKIIPPNFNDSKYEEVLRNKNKLPNLEIKFHIQDAQSNRHPQLSLNPSSLTLKENENKTVKIEINNDNNKEKEKKIIEELKNGYTKRLKILFNSDESGKIKINNDLVEIKNDENDKNEMYTDISRENINSNGKLELKFEYVATNGEVGIKNLEIQYFAGDIDIIYPTGLFYKPGLNLISTKTSNTEFNPNDWGIYLNKKGEDTVSPILQDYYQKTSSFLTKEEEEAKTALPSYEVSNLDIKLNEETKNIDIQWEPPEVFKISKSLNKDKFKYYIEFKPEDQNDKKNVFQFAKQIPITEEINPLNSSPQIELVKSYSFNKAQLKPGAKYLVTIRILKSIVGGKYKRSPIVEKEYVFADGLEDYHTHLYNPETDRFELNKLGNDVDTILANNPQLVATYYQMLAYNKKKARDEVQITNLNIKDNISCIKRNTSQFTNNNLGSNFQKDVDILVNKNALKEGQEFDVYQKKQQQQIESIKNKIEELEKHQNKKVSLSDLNIKALRSVIDGSILRLEELNGEKKLVRLNSGCLAYDKASEFGKKDEYSYVPCNTFDDSQFFVLNKINNLDEYNFLLANNLQPRVNDSIENVKYPFYVLQPNNSNKCVSINDKNLKIKPCSVDDSFKFKGYFHDKGCNV